MTDPNLTQPTALLLEGRPELRELEELILTEMGIRVEVPPPGADPVEFAANTHPRVIVVHIGVTEPYGVDVVDQLHLNARTRGIPVVAIAVTAPRAARAKASPNVPAAVVAPYEVDQIEDAVRRALHTPPPSATMPKTQRATSEYIRFAADELDRHAREVALRTVQRLLATEAYRAHFAELTPGLVDHLGAVLGEIAAGLRRGLSPGELLANPGTQQILAEHLQLRSRQGMAIGTVIQEAQALSNQIDQFVQGLVGQNSFTEADARDVQRRVHEYLQRRVRVIAERYPGSSASH